ncbi:MFS transporter [Paenibacillus sp. HJL G12]|uniref:MFS transporter n=1 Tax=Paenibacillus dendrobii TaxID=2691084 RepID=A0A7X3IPD8_9BACL|nr:MFS transporter [Paenibacillus dendrobii]MWV46440.1 MFS transporter [Paenibacillus dendrobii]
MTTLSSASSNASKRPASVWANKTFTRMFTAYAMASFGEWFDAFAIEILVAYRWHADPFMIALIPVMMALPGIVLGSFAGVIADRWKKVNLMMLADAAETVLTILLLFVPNMYWLLPLLLLRAAMGVIRVPAHQALTRQVVWKDQLLKATSYNGLVNQFSKIAGPLLGAVALTVISPQLCIAVNALTRLVSGILLFTLKDIDQNTAAEKFEETQCPEGGEGRKPSFIQLWKQGWSVLVERRLLLSSFIVNMTVTLVILMIDFQFPTLYREIAPNNESLLGWMIASTGVGAVLTILLLNRLGRVRYGIGIGGGVALIGAAFGCMGLLSPESSEAWSIVLGLFIGIGNGLTIVTYNYVLQKETPEGLTGRIFGIQNTSASTMMIAAPLIGGALIQGMGVGKVFFMLGIVVLVIGAGCLAFQRLLWPPYQVTTDLQASKEVSG